MSRAILDIANIPLPANEAFSKRKEGIRFEGFDSIFLAREAFHGLDIRCTRSILSLSLSLSLSRLCANAANQSMKEYSTRGEIVGSAMESIWRFVILRYPMPSDRADHDR